MKKIKILLTIYEFTKIYSEVIFRMFISIIILELSLVLKVMQSLSSSTKFFVIISLLIWSIKPILYKIENWRFWK